MRESYLPARWEPQPGSWEEAVLDWHEQVSNVFQRRCRGGMAWLAGDDSVAGGRSRYEVVEEAVVPEPSG